MFAALTSNATVMTTAKQSCSLSARYGVHCCEQCVRPAPSDRTRSVRGAFTIQRRLVGLSSARRTSPVRGRYVGHRTDLKHACGYAPGRTLHRMSGRMFHHIARAGRDEATRQQATSR